MNARRKIEAGIAVLAGVAIGLGSYNFLYAKGYSYLLNDPSACGLLNLVDRGSGAFKISSRMGGHPRSVSRRLTKSRRPVEFQSRGYSTPARRIHDPDIYSNGLKGTRESGAGIVRCTLSVGKMHSRASHNKSRPLRTSALILLGLI